MSDRLSSASEHLIESAAVQQKGNEGDYNTFSPKDSPTDLTEEKDVTFSSSMPTESIQAQQPSDSREVETETHTRQSIQPTYDPNVEAQTEQTVDIPLPIKEIPEMSPRESNICAQVECSLLPQIACNSQPESSFNEMACRLRREYLFSQKYSEYDVMRGLVPNPSCYTEIPQTDLDLEAEDAARCKHATYVEKMKMKPSDLKEYVYCIHGAVETEKFAKQLRCAGDGSPLSTKKTIQSNRGKNGAGLSIFSPPPKYDSDGEEESDNDDLTQSRCFNPFRLFLNCIQNLCCFGNRMCCHFDIIPLAGELTNGSCRSPLLCAVILSLTTLLFISNGVLEDDTVDDDDDSSGIQFFESFLPLLTFFMTVSGAGPISFILGLIGSTFSFYRSYVELYSDTDSDWFKTMYSHLVLALAGAQLGLVCMIGMTTLGKLGRMCYADCIQSLFGSVDGEDVALERFLYSRRLINWRPPLSVSHWKAKIRRQKLDPGRRNRFSNVTRFLNLIIDVPLSFLKMPVKLDWSLPPQSPDADTRHVEQVPVFYTIGLTLIGILVIVCLTLLFSAFDYIRPTVRKMMNGIVEDSDSGTQVNDLMDQYNVYVAITIAIIALALVAVMVLQLKALLDVVKTVRKGGCNGSTDPKKKIEQIKSSGPYRILDSVSTMFFTYCIFVALGLIVIPLFNAFWFILFIAPGAIFFDVVQQLVAWIASLVIKNAILLVGQWLLVSRLLTDATSLRHPRIFSFITPFFLVFQLSVNFVRVILSFLHTLITIPLMFVLPFSYSNSPLHNPLMAIIFFNDEANNSIKTVMTAYFLARTQMQQIIFLGENYGIRSGSFKTFQPKVSAPPNMFASVTASHGEVSPSTNTPQCVGGKVLSENQTCGQLPTEAKEDAFEYIGVSTATPKTKLIFVSLKVFGASELYQSQRNLIRLWVLLDYFPERFPRPRTPSASLHPSLEKTIFEELLEYVNWVLEPRHVSIEAQILDKSPHYLEHRERERSSDISPAIRDLWTSTVRSEFGKRTYRKEIVTMIMVAHGLIVTAESLKGVGDDTAARMVAVTSPRPYCHLTDVMSFMTRSLRMKGSAEVRSRGPKVPKTPTEAAEYFVAECLGSTEQVAVDDEREGSIPLLSHQPNRDHYPEKATPNTNLTEIARPLMPGNHATQQKERRAKEKLRKATAEMFEQALADFYEILEDQHQTRLKHLQLEERSKKAWLINALEHPNSILIPVRVWGGSDSYSGSDYLLPESSEDPVWSACLASKGKLLGAAFLASINPKCPKLIARDRACWRWRLALTLMLYPSLQRERKHYLRLNSFTPAKPLTFDPTGFL